MFIRCIYDGIGNNGTSFTRYDFVRFLRLNYESGSSTAKSISNQGNS